MAGPKRLTLFVEGPADRLAAPTLIKRLLGERQEPPWDALVPDDLPPFEVGELSGLMGLDKKTKTIQFDRWHQLLERAARTRKNLGGVLLLLDGDMDRAAGQPFCPGAVGRILAGASRQKGGGSLFSVAVVFLRMEYESLFVASYEKLGNRKPDVSPIADVEGKRGAKEWLDDNLLNGYQNVADQEELSRQIDFELARQRMSSFRRLERAIDHLITAFRTGHHIVSPLPPTAPAPTATG